MSDARRLSVSVVSSFAAHAAVVALFPGAPMTPPVVQARKGRVSLVIRRRSPQREATRSPSPRVSRVCDKKAVRTPGPPPPSREPARESPAPRPVRRERESELRRLSREPAPPELSSEPPPPPPLPPVREESGVRNPRLRGDARPRYPACCRSGSCSGGEPREGYVWVEVEVLPDGRAGRIRLLERSACRSMMRSVERFFRRTRFLPATRAGAPVRGKLRKKVVFRLVDD